jgi:hypothetical protein
MELDNIDFTKEIYLQYLYRIYDAMYTNKIIINNNIFIVIMLFRQSNNIFMNTQKHKTIKFKINIPYHFNETQIITFLLKTLTKKQLKKLTKIAFKLHENNCSYNFNIKNDWNKIRNDMVYNYKGLNQDALNAIIKN